MLPYKKTLKDFSRDLRNNMTQAEILLWSKLRYKQLLGLSFYRQKPVLNYIVDFYCHEAKLIIECDGSQHFEEQNIEYDKNRDQQLVEAGFCVLRFDNLQIMRETSSVLDHILNVAVERLK